MAFNINLGIGNPLASLLGGNSRFNFSGLQYPMNFDNILGSGHYIQFFINSSLTSRYLQGSNYNYPGGTTYKVVEPFRNNSNFSGSGITAGGYTIQFQQTKTISQAISLYLPDSMNGSLSTDWQESSLSDAGGFFLRSVQNTSGVLRTLKDKININHGAEAIRNISPAVIDMLQPLLNRGGMGGLGNYLLKISNYAVNPQVQLLFRGIDLRTFQFDFVLTPYDEGEAANIKNIINAFKFHMAPEVDPNYGRFFVTPSTFDIAFMYQGQENRNIHRISTCVLTDCNYDYAPHGWSCYTGGMPVQTILSLRFKELDIMTKEKIAALDIL